MNTDPPKVVSLRLEHPDEVRRLLLVVWAAQQEAEARGDEWEAGHLSAIHHRLQDLLLPHD